MTDQNEIPQIDIPASVVAEILKALRPVVIAHGYVHKDDIDQLLLEAQKCDTREGFREFAAKHWPDMTVRNTGEWRLLSDCEIQTRSPGEDWMDCNFDDETRDAFEFIETLIKFGSWNIRVRGES